MRYEVREQNAELFGVHAEADFSIAASGKAFQVLISGLYSDKPQSIVRETLANADDGNTAFRLRCIENNIDPPDLSIEVHAPTAWEPWYSVRDHGIGMTHRFVMTLYSRLFHSEKDTSDDLVGSFGLGSKSPFAYTNEFSVVVVLHGIKRIYTAFLTSTGAPKIVLNDAVWTDEPRGVTVTIPVREKDHKAFNEAISWASLGHSSEIICNKPQLVQRATWTHNYGDVHFFDSAKVRLPVNGPFVAVGPVWYPINWATVTASGAKLTCSEFWAEQENAVLRLPIGAVEVVPSREAISYSESTIEAILGAYNNVTQKRLDELRAEFDAPDNIWDRAAAVLRMKRELPFTDKLLMLTFDKDTQAYTDMRSRDLDVGHKDLRTFTLSPIATKVPGAPTHRLSMANDIPHTFDRGEETTAVLVIDEAAEQMPKSYRQRLRFTMQRMGLKTVYVAVLPDPLAVRAAAADLRKELDKHVLIGNDPAKKRALRVERLSEMFQNAWKTRAALKVFLDTFQCPHVLLTSDLVMPAKETFERAKTLTLLRNTGNGSMEDTELKSTDDAGRVFYFPTSNRRAMNTRWGGTVTESTLNAALKALGQEPVRLVGIGVSQVKIAKADPVFRPDTELASLFTPEMLVTIQDVVKTHDQKEFIWKSRRHSKPLASERLTKLAEIMGDTFPPVLAKALRDEMNAPKGFSTDLEFYRSRDVASPMRSVAHALQLDVSAPAEAIYSNTSPAHRYLQHLPELQHHHFSANAQRVAIAKLLGLDMADTLLCRSYGPPEAPVVAPLRQAA